MKFKKERRKKVHSDRQENKMYECEVSSHRKQDDNLHQVLDNQEVQKTCTNQQENQRHTRGKFPAEFQVEKINVLTDNLENLELEPRWCQKVINDEPQMDSESEVKPEGSCRATEENEVSATTQKMRDPETQTGNTDWKRRLETQTDHLKVQMKFKESA